MPIRDLNDLSQTQRESYLFEVFTEAERFRQPKEDKMVETFRYLRNLADQSSVFRTKLQHPYAFAAAQTLKAMIYPPLFAADPPIQLVDVNADNFPRNQLAERLLGAHILNPLRSNFSSAFERACDSAIWFGYAFTHTYFRSRYQEIGPRLSVRTMAGEPVLDDDGMPVIDEVYRKLRTYHAPWLVDNDVWDSWMHADGNRVFLRRDVTGYELVAQSEGDNPIYDPQAVNRMIRTEMFSKKTRSTQSFHPGTEHMIERDILSMEVGAEPPRHGELAAANYLHDALAKPYVIIHYDDGEHHGTFGVPTEGKRFLTLRWHRGMNYDGAPNWQKLQTWQSPQEIYGTSFFAVAEDLLKLTSNFYRGAGDAAALQVHPTFLGSGQMKMLGGPIVFGPGATIFTPQVNRSLEEHFKRLEIGKDFFSAFQLVQGVLKNDLDVLMSQDDPQRGIYSSGRHTAYETSVADKGSRNKVEVIIKKMHSGFVCPVVRKWMAMFTEHFGPRDFVLALGQEGASYIPPSIEEILTSLTYVPRGSITTADQQTRRAQWPGLFQAITSSLPFMQIPHVREAFERMMTDYGQEAVSRMIPSSDGKMTQYQERINQALMASSSQGGSASPPRSPTDISDLTRRIGGGMAPPGPVGMGGGNGSRTG